MTFAAIRFADDLNVTLKRYLIKTLTEFQHIDDNGRDDGPDVRARARDLSRLLAADKNLADAPRWRK